MPASRLMILGVAVAAAGGAGYVAKNMVAVPPPVAVEAGPQKPQIALQDVLVLSGDVPMGGVLGGNIKWEAGPSDGVNANFITLDSEAAPVVTEVPVTEVPATEVPVTEVPVTEVPVETVAPTEVVTEAPVTEIPVTDVPVTEVPVTEAPATDVPAETVAAAATSPRPF